MRQRLVSIDDYRKRAKSLLPRAIFDYVDGGVDSERSLARNRTAFEEIQFLPKRFRNVGVRSLQVQMFGTSLAAPLFISPTAFNGVLWPRGDIALAQSAAKAGIPFVLPIAAQTRLEEVADYLPANLRWFQLYIAHPRITDTLVGRADRAGYEALVLTVDVPVNGRRARDLRNGFAFPIRWQAPHAAEYLRHPRWLYRYARHGSQQLANLIDTGIEERKMAVESLLARNLGAELSWNDLARLRSRWPRRLIVKGVLDPEDASRCFDFGVDAVLISNHGGRQLDCVPAPVSVLAGLAANHTDTLLVDGGVRRGSDVVKAVALGAAAAGLGRAVQYSLAVGGRTAVSDVLDLLINEIDITLAQIGCASVAQLNETFLRADGARASARVTGTFRSRSV